MRLLYANMVTSVHVYTYMYIVPKASGFMDLCYKQAEAVGICVHVFDAVTVYKIVCV